MLFEPAASVVRLTDGTLRLIDFDAAVPMGEPAGAKTSTGFCPPEFAREADSPWDRAGGREPPTGGVGFRLPEVSG